MKSIKPEVTDPPLPPASVHPVATREPLPKMIVIIVYVLLVGFGVLTGYLLTSNPTASSKDASTAVTTDAKTGKKAYGSSDTKVFNTSATGVLQLGGIEKEGTHSLIRPGGPTQTVCLVSSTLDLAQFIGKTVKVYGITYAAKKCPWLMDIGRVEIQ